jgi:hypothetical protein
VLLDALLEAGVDSALELLDEVNACTHERDIAIVDVLLRRAPALSHTSRPVRHFPSSPCASIAIARPFGACEDDLLRIDVAAVVADAMHQDTGLAKYISSLTALLSESLSSTAYQRGVALRTCSSEAADTRGILKRCRIM